MRKKKDKGKPQGDEGKPGETKESKGKHRETKKPIGTQGEPKGDKGSQSKAKRNTRRPRETKGNTGRHSEINGGHILRSDPVSALRIQPLSSAAARSVSESPLAGQRYHIHVQQVRAYSA